jgi:hypothetical protein
LILWSLLSVLEYTWINLIFICLWHSWCSLIEVYAFRSWDIWLLLQPSCFSNVLISYDIAAYSILVFNCFCS